MHGLVVFRARQKQHGTGEIRGNGLTAAHEDLVGAVLIAQLGSIALPWLELDGDLLLVEQVGALEDDAERALANLLADAIVDAHDVGRRCVSRRHSGLRCGALDWRDVCEAGSGGG